MKVWYGVERGDWDTAIIRIVAPDDSPPDDFLLVFPSWKAAREYTMQYLRNVLDYRLYDTTVTGRTPYAHPANDQAFAVIRDYCQGILDDLSDTQSDDELGFELFEINRRQRFNIPEAGIPQTRVILRDAGEAYAPQLPADK